MTLFDAELGLMHAAADAVFAVTASFRPASGPAVACKVEQHLPETELGLTDARAVTPDVVFKVLKAGLPKRPGRGDVFEVESTDWRVIESAAIEDDDGKRYVVKVERCA